MSSSNSRILIVEDDADLSCALARTLSEEGFVCDRAANGAVASAMLAANNYHILLTDLRMPMLNGHALSVAALACQPRPLVVVLTGVIEPRLAADLLIRGVDDLIFKPIPGTHLAAKCKALLARRSALETRTASGTTTISADDLEGKLCNVKYALPISQIALDLIRLTTEEETTVAKLAEVLSRDASLTIEVLRLANSQFYASSAPKVMDVEQAVVRIGTRRLAEIASATSALAGVARRTFTWMDSDLFWRQCAAGGIAMGLLSERVRLTDHGGLFVASLTQGLGRVVLGALYPGIYELLTRSCAATGETLLEQEVRSFPCRHAEVMATVLSKWGFPPTVYQPLRHTLSSYDDMEYLSEPLRTKVELCKIAEIIGRLAVGKFEPWDIFEPVPGPVLAKYNLRAWPEVVAQTRANLHRLAAPDESVAPQVCDAARTLEATGELVGYVSLSSARGDFLHDVLISMGMPLEKLDPECLATGRRIIVNCIELPTKRIAHYLGSGLFADSRLIITDRRHADEHKSLGKTLTVPVSFSALLAACQQLFRAG